MKKLFLTALFLSSPLLAEDFSIPNLDNGMYSYPSASKIPDNSAAYIQNFLSDVEPILVERNGYVKRDNTVLGGTKPVYGLWQFTDSTGADWIISYSSRTYYKNTVGNTPTAFGPTATVDQIPDAAVNLGKIMFVNGTDTAWTFNGTSTAAVSGAPVGTLIEAWRTRFAISNITNSKSTIRFSADGDETNWVLGGNATDPFSIQVGGANEGEYVRCLVGSYLDSMIIGRKYDLWALDGFDQGDIQLRNISKNIGCIESRSVVEVDGELVFMSHRGLEAMANRTIRNISEPIRDTIDAIVKNSTNQRSDTQTSQTDWSAGTLGNSNFPASNLSTSISPGNIVLSTMVESEFTDTLTSDFSSGALTLTSALNDNLTLLSYASIQNQQYASDSSDVNTCGASGGGGWAAVQFYSGTGFSVSSVTVRLKIDGNTPTRTSAISITSDSSNTVGSDLTSATFLPSALTTSYSDLAVDLTPITLTPNTSYWIKITPSLDCKNDLPQIGRVLWANQVSAGIRSGTNNGASSSYDTGFPSKYKIHGSSFSTSGNIVSRTLDVGFSTNTWLFNYRILTATATLPTGSTITYQTQSSPDGVSFNSLVGVNSGSTPASIGSRYFRYKASFTTVNTATSPVLSGVSISAGPFMKSSGTFTSQAFATGASISSWGPVTISDSQNGGSIVYQFGSTTTASVSAITNWATIVNGGIPSVSTGTFAAFRSTMTASFSTSTVFISEFVTTWLEGGAVPSPVATVFDRRYWISFTTSVASAPSLDSVFVWQRNKSWVLFKGIMAGSFALWRDSLYFGNSNATGYVYRFDVGNNDDGTSISSVLITKSYDLGQPFREKWFRYSYPIYLGNTSYTGSFTMGYTLDRNTNSYNMASVGLNSDNGQICLRFPFRIGNRTVGREVQFSLSKSDSGDRLKLGGISTVYELKEER